MPLVQDLLPVPPGPAELVVTYTGRPERFDAAGLTLGGQHGWEYEFRFPNLNQ
jgi:hypothetical protein